MKCVPCERLGLFDKRDEQGQIKGNPATHHVLMVSSSCDEIVYKEMCAKHAAGYKDIIHGVYGVTGNIYDDCGSAHIVTEIEVREFSPQLKAEIVLEDLKKLSSELTVNNSGLANAVRSLAEAVKNMRDTFGDVLYYRMHRRLGILGDIRMLRVPC